jgi:hypothetical protein
VTSCFLTGFSIRQLVWTNDRLATGQTVASVYALDKTQADAAKVLGPSATWSELLALKRSCWGAASLCDSPSLPKANPHTELGIEDVFDTVWRVIGGCSAFFYRRKKPNHGLTSLGGGGVPRCNRI